MRKRKVKKFSEKKYYWLVGGFALIPILWALKTGSVFPVVIFLIFGVMGMLAETLLSEWWGAFFDKPFYEYKVEGNIHKRTSRLNFLPWGAGGLLCLGLLNLFENLFPQYGIGLNNNIYSEFYSLFVICFFAAFSFQFMARAFFEFFHPRSFKFKRVTILSYLFINLPFLFALGVCSLVFSKGLLLLAIVFGLVATVLEYLYGKALEYFLGRKFWVYYPHSFDHGHFTPLAIIPFSMVGFFFWAVYGLSVWVVK